MFNEQPVQHTQPPQIHDLFFVILLMTYSDKTSEPCSESVEKTTPLLVVIVFQLRRSKLLKPPCRWFFMLLPKSLRDSWHISPSSGNFPSRTLKLSYRSKKILIIIYLLTKDLLVSCTGIENKTKATRKMSQIKTECYRELLRNVTCL